jgi:Hemerythrin HHE cation binding domain
MYALKSAPLRKQHESLRKHIAAIKKLLNPVLLAASAVEVRNLLTQMYGELGKHLQQEGKELYQALEGGEDADAKAVAARFGQEMKLKMPALAEFNRNWPNSDAIRANGHQFIKEAEPLLGWLEKRFVSENNELYPLLDKQDAANMVSASNPELKISRI